MGVTHRDLWCESILCSILFTGSPCQIRSQDSSSLVDCEKECKKIPSRGDNSIAYLDTEATCICGPLSQLFE